MKSTVTIGICICVSFYIDFILAIRIFRRSKVISTVAEEETDFRPVHPTPLQLQFQHNGHSAETMDWLQAHLDEAFEHACGDNFSFQDYKEELELAHNKLTTMKNRYAALIHLREQQPCLANMWNNTNRESLDWMLSRTKYMPKVIDQHKCEHRKDKTMMRKMAEVKEVNRSVRALIKKDLKWRKKHYPV